MAVTPNTRVKTSGPPTLAEVFTDIRVIGAGHAENPKVRAGRLGEFAGTTVLAVASALGMLAAASGARGTAGTETPDAESSVRTKWS
jgi:hypothetical protein